MQISTRIGVVQAMAFPFSRIPDRRFPARLPQGENAARAWLFIRAFTSLSPQAAITAPHTTVMGISAEKCPRSAPYPFVPFGSGCLFAKTCGESDESRNLAK